MLFLFGEKTISTTEELGHIHCPVCNDQKRLIRVIEKNYFTVFFIRILPLEVSADYHQCSGCGHAYKGDGEDGPTAYALIKLVLAYLVSGFSVERGVEGSQKVFHTVTGTEVSPKDIQDNINKVDREGGVLDLIRESASEISWVDKSDIVEAAFLLVYAARPIAYEERLQINLIANALGIGIEGVNAIINSLQSQQYKGIGLMELENR